MLRLGLGLLQSLGLESKQIRLSQIRLSIMWYAIGVLVGSVKVNYIFLRL